MKTIATFLAIVALALGAGSARAAPSFLVVDLDTNRVVHESGPESPRSIASITKLMTAVTILESGLDLDEPIAISKADYVSSTAVAGLRTLTRRDLLLLALVKSDNGAAHALARTYPGGHDAFISEMNHIADDHIRMTNTNFVDSSGLAAGNKSTPTDLIKLVIYSQRYRFIREASDMRDVTIGRRIYSTTNRMLRAGWDIIVAKTGLTNAAGQCYVAIWQEGSHRLGIVVLGSNNRWRDTEALRVRVLSKLRSGQ